MRVAIVDAYSRAGRVSLANAGCTPAGQLYKRVATAHAPEHEYTVLLADAAARSLPSGVAAGDFDAVLWTGSELTIYQDDDEVRAQIDLARTLMRAGVPNFGSCWAAQLAAVSFGGSCGPCPKGREFGIARDITLNDEGVEHPMYRGKPRVFCSYASHGDEITQLPPNARILASNAWSKVQALEVRVGGATFCATQYHPEYDLCEVAQLGAVRGPGLVEQGLYKSQADADAYFAQLRSLHKSSDPSLAAELGVGDDLLDAEVRQREIANWLGGLTLKAS